jgi:hypothetical protein
MNGGRKERTYSYSLVRRKDYKQSSFATTEAKASSTSENPSFQLPWLLKTIAISWNFEKIWEIAGFDARVRDVNQNGFLGSCSGLTNIRGMNEIRSFKKWLCSRKRAPAYIVLGGIKAGSSPRMRLFFFLNCSILMWRFIKLIFFFNLKMGPGAGCETGFQRAPRDPSGTPVRACSAGLLWRVRVFDVHWRQLAVKMAVSTRGIRRGGTPASAIERKRAISNSASEIPKTFSFFASEYRVIDARSVQWPS